MSRLLFQTHLMIFQILNLQKSRCMLMNLLPVLDFSH